MKGVCEVLTWFSDRELRMLPDSCVVVGGTQLLRHFLRGVADRTSFGASGHLVLGAPFVGANLSDHLAALPHIAHERVDVLIVTAGRGDAERCSKEFGQFPWRSIQINVRSKLHAKIFSFNESTGGGLCLVGSHNLTRGGAVRNEEAGVLFVGTGRSSTAQTIHACQERVIQIARESVRFSDSLMLDGQAA
jgi:phosphatidylserine/phosphatidylglycerophosphate/cardiolipin synthase-like enzyme